MTDMNKTANQRRVAPGELSATGIHQRDTGGSGPAKRH